MTCYAWYELSPKLWLVMGLHCLLDAIEVDELVVAADVPDERRRELEILPQLLRDALEKQVNGDLLDELLVGLCDEKLERWAQTFTAHANHPAVKAERGGPSKVS